MTQMANDMESKAKIDELAKIEFCEDKQEFVNKLKELWDTHPEYRFGQLLQHILGEVKGHLFFVPDGVFYSELQRFIDTGFKGVDRKIPNRIGMDNNSSISVKDNFDKYGEK